MVLFRIGQPRLLQPAIMIGMISPTGSFLYRGTRLDGATSAGGRTCQNRAPSSNSLRYSTSDRTPSSGMALYSDARMPPTLLCPLS